MGVFFYMLGLSYRAVETFLLAFEWKGYKSSMERDVAQAGQKAKALHMQAPAMRVRILGVDGTGVKMAGQKALSHPYLAQFIRRNEGICDFREVI